MRQRKTKSKKLGYGSNLRINRWVIRRRFEAVGSKRKHVLRSRAFEKIIALRSWPRPPALPEYHRGSDRRAGTANTLALSYHSSVSPESYPAGIREYRAIPATLPSSPPELLQR